MNIRSRWLVVAFAVVMVFCCAIMIFLAEATSLVEPSLRSSLTGWSCSVIAASTALGVYQVKVLMSIRYKIYQKLVVKILREQF